MQNSKSDEAQYKKILRLVELFQEAEAEEKEKEAEEKCEIEYVRERRSKDGSSVITKIKVRNAEDWFSTLDF